MGPGEGQSGVRPVSSVIYKVGLDLIERLAFKFNPKECAEA